MKILITGGAGFIGSHLADALVGRAHEVVIYDNLDPQVHPGSKHPAYLNKKARFVRGDVLDYAKLKKALESADIVFHLAAKVGVGQSQYEIKEYSDVNIGGTANLLDIIVNSGHRPKKLLVAGSMSSYGEGLYACKKCGRLKPDLRAEKLMKSGRWEPLCPRCGAELNGLPTPETTPLDCNSIYALTKKAQEEMSLVIGRTYKIPTTVMRFFNVYGPRQSLSNPYTGVAAIFMSRIKNANRPVIYEDGLQSRDFIYVGDIVKGLILAMNKKSADYEVFNLGAGRPVAIKAVADIIAGIYGKDIRPDVTGRYRKGDVRHCFADISKARRALGFKPSTDFASGMRLLCAWAYGEKAMDKYALAARELKEKGLA
ncbi:MAG: GDP-mannose 4,6-dehydratase [Endomicrobiia bacterium]|nr:GDP-mannose 4,6-dehydratase [Endomicrobiia bacterium]